MGKGWERPRNRTPHRCLPGPAIGCCGRAGSCAPTGIYKARAGALFGSRILMLEHIGRKSGTPRYAVLELVDHPAPETYVVASGFGRKAQ